MAVGDLVTDDWEFEFRGFGCGGDDSDFLIAPGMSGLADNPDVVVTDRTRLQRDGLHPGDDYYLGREVIIPIEVSGIDVDAWEANRALLKEATRVDRSRGEDWLVFQVPGIADGGKRRIRAKPRGLAVPMDLDFFYGITVEMARFIATKPFIYDDAETLIVSGALEPSSSGLTCPLTWPLNWGDAAAASFFATKEGNYEAEWRAVITGPVVDPTFVNVSTGQELGFEIAVAEGDYIEIGSGARTALLNGTASRRSSLTRSDWFTLAPGSNELSYRAASGASSISVTFRSTWS